MTVKKGNILFIGGSFNQTTMMHKISKYFSDYDCYFSPFFADGYMEFFRKRGMLEFTVLGGKFRLDTEKYFLDNNLNVDYKGASRDYDLVFTCSDLLVPRKITRSKLILVQEGMTDPENLMYYLVKWLGLPRYLASTSTNGLSDAYDKFCVASEGYKDLFIRKGVRPEKLEVTGIPNFDNCEQYIENDFPYRNFVLVATSDSRETFKLENRKKFIRYAVEIAAGKQLIFKLHPNEKFDRAVREINRYAPGALVYTDGNINEMIANCDVLITKYSSVVYVGLALGKKVYSYFKHDELLNQLPIQNGGSSAENIAEVGLQLLKEHVTPFRFDKSEFSLSGVNI